MNDLDGVFAVHLRDVGDDGDDLAEHAGPERLAVEVHVSRRGLNADALLAFVFFIVVVAVVAGIHPHAAAVLSGPVVTTSYSTSLAGISNS
ncbi:MAG: hypothetical protein KAJ19_15270 [Gammaproteobacteria bacterium]|nr:hypothetical protein [Gammaproteobacteria bacterium]